MAVRTKTLAVHSGAAAAPTAVYTCPTGETAIIKSIVLGKTGAAASDVTLTILRGATAYLLAFVQQGIGTTTETLLPYSVLSPGDVLRIQVSTGSSTLWVSGVELEGVAD